MKYTEKFVVIPEERYRQFIQVKTNKPHNDIEDSKLVEDSGIEDVISRRTNNLTEENEIPSNLAVSFKNPIPHTVYENGYSQGNCDPERSRWEKIRQQKKIESAGVSHTNSLQQTQNHQDSKDDTFSIPKFFGLLNKCESIYSSSGDEQDIGQDHEREQGQFIKQQQQQQQDDKEEQEEIQKDDLIINIPRENNNNNINYKSNRYASQNPPQGKLSLNRKSRKHTPYHSANAKNTIRDKDKDKPVDIQTEWLTL